MRGVPASLLSLLLLAGCAADRSPGVNEYLDSETAVTVRTVDEPTVYAHEAPELAANARDYLSAGVVEVINMDKRSRYLALVSWSTIDRNRPGAGPAPIPDRIEIPGAGGARELTPVSHESRSLGISAEPFRPAAGYVGESWYALTVADLRAFAKNPPQSLEIVDATAGRITYTMWRDGTGALREFVRDLPDPAPSDPRRR